MKSAGLRLPLDQTYESRYATVKMCSSHIRPTGQFIKIQRRDKEEKERRKDLGIRKQGRCFKVLGYIWRHTFAIWEEWIVLFFMAIIVAILSFLMDKAVMACINARLWLFNDIATQPFEKYVAWISLPIVLILFSHGWMCILAPQTGGSGIPEIKTILCGMVLKEHLTFRALLAKVAGAAATVGSGMPLGKKGPLIHIASVTVRLLARLVMGLHGMHESEGRSTEMLASACAVGVACTFYAPIAGVLMSIELTTSYYAIRNYWRCFFAAVVGATFYKLLYVWNFDMNTIAPNFKTAFKMDAPFHPNELIVFGLIGAVCGVFGALYVWLHRTYVTFLKTNKVTSYIMSHYRFIYPGLVSWGIASLIYPPGLGQFMAGDLPHGGHLNALFGNFPWTNNNLTFQQQEVVDKWLTPYTGIYINLLIFLSYNFIFSIIAATIPVPSGCFMPVFKIGAAFGRIIGEAMNLWWLGGIWYGSKKAQIIPGGYALVGAAAFAASVSRTVSVAVLSFEMTGQITHVIPVLIAVLVSNGVGSLIAPSMFDSIIVVKKLPYLPELLPNSSAMYAVFVEDFMTEDVKFLHYGMSYGQLKSLLTESKKIQRFPLVDSKETRILMGSIHRLDLIDALDAQIGREKRLYVAAIRQKKTRFNIRDSDEFDSNHSRFYVSPVNEDGSAEGHIGEESTLEKTACPGLESFTEIDPKYVITTRSKQPKSKLQRALSELLRSRPPFDRGDDWRDEMVERDPYRTHIVPVNEMMSGRVTKPLKYVQDMTPSDRKTWEAEQLQHTVNFSLCRLDPAPFQLVEGTSLLKVHSFFSMVGINYAYVTSKSKLVGVVGAKELRMIIQDVNNNKLPTPRGERRSIFPLKTPHSKVNNERDDGATFIRISRPDKYVRSGEATKV